MITMKNDMETDRKTPLHYEKSGTWLLNVKGWALVIMLTGGILTFVLSFIIGIIVRDLLRGVHEGQISFAFISFPVIVGIIAAAVVLHEAVHGALFLAMGGRPRFGFKLIGKFFPVAYATSTVPLPKNQYLLVCLGPLLFLTPVFQAAGVLIPDDSIAALALYAMAMNVSGSFGDLKAAFKVMRFSRKTLFVDTEDGFIWRIPSDNG